MRIAVLSAANSVHTVRWVSALAERGHQVALYSLPDHPAAIGTVPGDAEVHYLSRGGVAGYWFGSGELRRRLREFRPDLLNAHYATGYGTLARRCGFRPLLLSVWGSDVYDFPRQGVINRKILTKNLAEATAIASTSFAMARQVRRIYPAAGEIFVTPFGVDADVFRPVGKPCAGRLTIGIVKTLEPKYGVEDLIRAFALLCERLTREGRLPEKGISLEIYGGGSLRGGLENLSRRLAPGLVQFHGPAPHAEVPKILSGFDLFCAPSVSDSESFGVAAVEAMACGIPVVVSDVDGFQEVVVDGVTGLVVPRKNPEALADGMYRLACDSGLRERFGRAGREHVVKNYAWPGCVDKMETALRATVERYGRPLPF